MPGFEGCAYAVSFSKQFDVTPVFRSSWPGNDESSVDDSSSTVFGSVSDADAAGAAIIAELNLPSQSLQAQQSAILSGCLHRQGGPFSWCAPISILSNRTRGRARSAAPPRPQQPRTAMHFAQFCCCVLLGKPLILTVACATWGKPRRLIVALPRDCDALPAPPLPSPPCPPPPCPPPPCVRACMRAHACACVHSCVSVCVRV